MVIKISTKTSDGRGIPVIVDDKPVGFIRDAPELLRKVLQAMLEDMNNLRKDVKEKDEWIEQLLEDEQRYNELLEEDDDDVDWWRDDE